MLGLKFRFLLPLLGTILLVPAAHAQGSDCKAVFQSIDKITTTPNHFYATYTGAMTDGKPMKAEGIVVSGVRYMMVLGKWTQSPVTLQEERDRQQQNRKNATSYTCRHLRDESVNGESAEVYSSAYENKDTKSDAQIWISKSKGLILREEEDISTGKDKTHVSYRYDYNNVQAPKL